MTERDRVQVSLGYTIGPCLRETAKQNSAAQECLSDVLLFRLVSQLPNISFYECQYSEIPKMFQIKTILILSISNKMALIYWRLLTKQMWERDS